MSGLSGAEAAARCLAVVALGIGFATVAPASGQAAVTDRNLQCLTDNIYFEARDDGPAGWAAVGHVTLNRWSVARQSKPATSLCDVVYEGAGRGRNRCQFSWTCDGRPKVHREADTFREINRMAHDLLVNHHADPTAGAFFFHERGVRPKWASDGTAVLTTSIGRHFYYRPAKTSEKTEFASIR